MNNSEILARWQGLSPTLTKDSVWDANFKEVWPDYPNGPAACVSLLDTLVEKGYGVRIFYDDITPGIENRWVVEVLSDKSYWGAHKLFNEAIVAACLEVARKEQSDV